MGRQRILLLCDYDPTSPLIGPRRVDSFAQGLTVLGWEVRVLSRSGLTTYTTQGRCAPEGATERHPERRALRIRSKWLRRALIEIYQRFIAVPDRGVFGLRALHRHARQLAPWRPHVIVASGPPFSTFLLARRWARTWRIPWVADYRDLWTNSTYYVCGPVRRRLDQSLEKRIIRTAALAVTVSAPLAADLHRDFGVESTVVMNGYDPSELREVPERTPPQGLPVRMVYTGEIYAGRTDPSPLFRALRLAGVTPVELLVEFRGMTVTPLADLAERHGVGDLVRVGPAVSRVESLALQRSSDVQLLMLWDHPSQVGIFSGKLFEYLGSQRPILMLGYEHGVAADLIRERRAGHVVNDPKELAALLRHWVEEKRINSSLPGNEPDVAEGLTRQEQTEKLHGLLTRIIGGQAAQNGPDEHRR